jgi:hypothetical protein
MTDHKCEDCRHSILINANDYDRVQRLVCLELRKISCVFARGEFGKCGPSAELWVSK